MRIELQLVAFEHGNCALIPVAAAAGRPSLANQLIISRFAISKVAGNRRRGRNRPAVVPVADVRHMCHVGTEPAQREGQKLTQTGANSAIPIQFAAPVSFAVPVGSAN